MELLRESKNASRRVPKACGKHRGITYIFAEGGLPVEDVAWACDCYDAAREMQIGTSLNLWDIPAMQ